MATRRAPVRQPAPEPPPELASPRSEAEQKLGDRIAKGQDLQARASEATRETLDAIRDETSSWHEYNLTLLRVLFTTEGVADDYRRSTMSVGASINSFDDPFPGRFRAVNSSVSTRVRKLESIRAQLEIYAAPDDGALVQTPAPQRLHGDEVFIVHGHDGAAREAAARWLQQITGRAPTILHEKPNKGMTVIEKFETHGSDAGFAVVLLTGDDLGGVDDQHLQARGRQNVVFELGFFVGAIGRSRVAVLYEEGVELPSDLSGLVYIALDGGEGWKLKLAKELKAAGVEVDASKLL